MKNKRLTVILLMVSALFTLFLTYYSVTFSTNAVTAGKIFLQQIFN